MRQTREVEFRPGYREWAPPDDLRHAVVCLWARVHSSSATTTTSALVIPDACSDLIWESGRGAFVAGPDTRPQATTLAPGTILLGARFRPGAGGPALRTPLAPLRNQRVDLDGIGSVLHGRLRPEDAVDRLVEVVADLLDSGGPDPLVDAATDALADPSVRVAALAASLGTSERHLRRRLDESVGYGPKTLQGVLRFRRFVEFAGAGGRQETDLAGLAFALGYADQAHLTRECRRFSGMTPRTLVRRLGGAG